jgi:hypothetical protein
MGFLKGTYMYVQVATLSIAIKLNKRYQLKWSSHRLLLSAMQFVRVTAILQ